MLTDLIIKPGIYTDVTDRMAQGRWVDGNRVRFRQGLPERIGGWNKKTSQQATGVCRALFSWTDLDGDRIQALGTTTKLQIEIGGDVADITPYRIATSDTYGGSESNLSNPFDTTNGSAVVTVNHTTHGLVDDAVVYFANASAVGGITIDGEYSVTEVVDDNSYTITHSAAATSTVSGGGGTVHYAYEINPGAASPVSGSGYGLGAWDIGTYGTPRSAQTTIAPARTWALVNWGEDLIANPRNGGIFIWDASAGTSTRADYVSANAPDSAAWVVVSPLDRHLIAYGAETGGAQDKMYIAWCDQNDYTTWTATRTNTAGDIRLDRGSLIVAAFATKQEILIWTDEAVYSQYFTGPPRTFGFRLMAENVGLIAPRAHTELNNVVFWMSFSDFYVYDGRVQILRSDVRNYVFDDINLSQKDKFFACNNGKFQEVWFFYVSAASTEIDRYVLYNVAEGTWSIGELSRTAWFDVGESSANPLAVDADGNIWLHEDGYEDDGSDMGDWIESHDIEVPRTDESGGGELMIFVDRLIPDFVTLDASVSIQFAIKRYPQSSTTKTKGPYTITGTTEQIKPRLRGRQMSMRIDGLTGNGLWRMGIWRADVRAHGRR